MLTKIVQRLQQGLKSIEMKFINIGAAKRPKSLAGLPSYMLMGALLLSITSCVNLKKSTYFYNTGDSTFRGQTTDLEPIIERNDLLSINVSSVNPEAAEIFNVSNLSTGGSSTVSGTTAQVAGYLVDTDGFIRFPLLGKLQAAGKSKKALREEITKELENRKLLLDPIVDIRYLNFTISVLGEVKNPSVLTIPDEKVTLLEALGLAGDITIYGNRENVVLIRESQSGSKIFKRMDLTSNEIFNSPYYYLKSNDVVYVEANKSAVVRASSATQWIPVILSALSLAVISVASFR